MSKIYPHIDPTGLLEYSVVFTDRSLNHMSATFQQVMRGIADTLKRVYHAAAVVVVPGGGTYGMEAVARQFASGRHCLVLRNGWFSYRWTQIFEMGAVPASHTVLKARPCRTGPEAAFIPAPVGEVEAAIARERPAVVFAPHVETASGIMLPDDYLRRVAAAVHAVGGLFVLDCIASGAVWVDMAALGIDVVISAPQKGWSGSPGCALVMLGSDALQRLPSTCSTSFACDLRKWHQIMQAYEAGGHAYHATMPTDALARFYAAAQEMAAIGFAELAERQHMLGQRVRSLMATHNFVSVAPPEFAAPGVVVCYTGDDALHKGTAFASVGLQTAAGVPLMCDEPDGYKTFRIGLFGLDKLMAIDRTVTTLAAALDRIGQERH